MEILQFLVVIFIDSSFFSVSFLEFVLDNGQNLAAPHISAEK